MLNPRSNRSFLEMDFREVTLLSQTKPSQHQRLSPGSLISMSLHESQHPPTSLQASTFAGPRTDGATHVSTNLATRSLWHRSSFHTGTQASCSTHTTRQFHAGVLSTPPLQGASRQLRDRDVDPAPRLASRGLDDSSGIDRQDHFPSPLRVVRTTACNTRASGS